MIRNDPACREIIKPFLRGGDLRPWYQTEIEDWLVFTRRGIDIDAYPSVKEYLQQFRERLEPKPKGWPRSKKWTGRKGGAYEWYEIQDTVDYYEAFEVPKVFWPDITKYPRFSWDDSGKYVNDKGFILIPTRKSLLGILQSRAGA